VTSSARSTARANYVAGAKAGLPLFLPGIPFGVVLGVFIAESTVPNVVGFLGNYFIFGGAAQLAVVAVLGGGGGLLSSVAAGLVVNARHFMYSAAVADRFRDQPTWFRWLGPYTLIDQVFALCTLSAPSERDAFRHYYLGASTVMWIPWQIAVAVGLVAGAGVPDSWELTFAVPVLFLGLTVLTLTRRPAFIGAVVGFFVSAAASPLPNRSGLLVGALTGIVVAALVDRGDE
jgi:4-azaleucine resistance transporter AzlC